MSDSLPNDSAAGTGMPALRGHSRGVRRIVMVVLIFLGGAAFGAAVATYSITHRAHQAVQSPRSMAAHITARLGEFLNLNEAQAQQVREIIVRRHEALADIRRELQPRLEQELTILEAEIAAVLDEDQRARWHAHAASIRAQWLPPLPSPESSK